MKVAWKKLIVSILIPLAVGGLSALLSGGGMKHFEALNKPPLSPPGAAFPIVWTILYLLMGISVYLIAVTGAKTDEKRQAMIVYGIQLAFNFFWSILFFRAQMYLAAFIWLAVMWVLIGYMIWRFYRISPKAALLQIPYLVWVTFAGYLNFMIYWLNR